jgi:hypothetical protein
MFLDSDYPGFTAPTVVVYRDHAQPAFLLCAGKIETWYNAVCYVMGSHNM